MGTGHTDLGSEVGKLGRIRGAHFNTHFPCRVLECQYGGGGAI